MAGPDYNPSRGSPPLLSNPWPGTGEFKIYCRPVRSGEDLEQCLAVREEVFVKEQGLFEKSDRDRCDDISVHIAGLVDGKIVGTVRIYPAEDGIWHGGRLAVLPGFRGRLGRMLVEKAMALAREQGGTGMLAYVQISRAPFFKRCGWQEAGPVLDLHGRPHRLMRVDLARSGEPAGSQGGEGN